MKFKQQRFLVADVIKKLPVWVQWIACQPQGWVVACADKPRLEGTDLSAADWDIRGEHFIIGQAKPPEDGVAWLQAVMGEDRLDEKAFRHRPKLIRDLMLPVSADSCAVTVDPDGRIREWFIALPRLTPVGWLAQGPGRCTTIGWLANPERDVWTRLLTLQEPQT